MGTGNHILIAWSLIQNELPNTKLVIAGRPDPKYLEKLKKLTNKLRLDRIEFLSNISENTKKQLLTKAKVLIYTSIREGWGANHNRSS